MVQIRFFLLLFCTITLSVGIGQSIYYSEPDKDDSRFTDVEIIGKFNGNILVYKSSNSLRLITVYGPTMKTLDRINPSFLPDKIFSPEFITLPGSFYIVYQYQRKNIYYAMAAKLDSSGHIDGSPIQLDTTELNGSAMAKIYTLVVSQNKQRFGLIKVNNRKEQTHYVTISVFDNNMKQLTKRQFPISMEGRGSFLGSYQINNLGGIAILRSSGTSQGENIGKLSLISYPYQSDSLRFFDIPLNGLFLDELTVTTDNVNKHFLISSFFTKQKRGNIEGLYNIVWDFARDTLVLNSPFEFTENMRNDAKGDNSSRSAFNNYFIKDILLKKDGGFITIAESSYSSSRGINNNRWDFGSPYSSYNSYYSNYGFYGGGYNPFGRNGYNNITRYFTENVELVSFDVEGKSDWSNTLIKSQYDDNSENFLSYGLLITGSELHFLYNSQERTQTLLTDQSFDGNGRLNRLPTLHNLERDFEFMPRQGKQTGLRQMIIPCIFKSSVCFAKIEFDGLK